MPIRRTRSGCCARATNDQATAAPPTKLMNSRRFIVALEHSQNGILPAIQYFDAPVVIDNTIKQVIDNAA